MTPKLKVGREALLILGILAVQLAISPQVAAQTDEPTETTPPLATDRPTDSVAPVIVPKGSFQMGAGYKFSRLDDEPGEVDSHVLPDLLLRYGINKKIEARLFAAGWTFQSGADDLATGFTDISLGTKILLAEEKGRRPRMGLLVDVSVPVGHSDHTNDYVIPKVLFLGSNSLNDRLALTYNLGPSYITEESNGGSDSNVDLNYAVALSGSVGGPVSLFSEFYGAFASGSERLDRHNFQAGTTILLSRLFQIDLRGGLGLVDHEPDWLVGAGLAFRVPH
jgi:hypothetical protein